MLILKQISRLKLFAILLLGTVTSVQGETNTDKQDKLVLAHYMPWFQAKPINANWGWHWTMNYFDPESTEKDGLKIASHFTPLIGPYDSSDPKVIEYQLLTMRLAGIDGVIIDWYGRKDFRDYKAIHESTMLLVEQINRMGMKFVICYEDQVLGPLVESGIIQSSDRVEYVVSDLEWLAANWFSLPAYVKLDGNPVLLSFGLDGLSNNEWSDCIEQSDSEIAYFSEHHKRDAAIGAFDWPIPSLGLEQIKRFKREAEQWSESIPAAFPRFVDVYEQADVHPSWGRIEDNDGETFRKSLIEALQSDASIVQLVTWNDWGEGTVIEPSVEFGYRDLETLQELRTQFLGDDFSASCDDLALPLRLLQLRRRLTDTDPVTQMDQVSDWLSNGDCNRAHQALRKLESL